tara:strand:- start:408 stop:1298 length:891 start_codon:yes stop_codon:yes gene_type:complete
MNILVTGAGGFIGSVIAKHLAKKGHKVLGTWHKNSKRIKNNKLKNLKYVKVDLTDARKIKKIFRRKKFNSIFHASAVLNKTKINEIIDHNILGFMKLVNLAVSSGCKHFVFFSSISVYESSNVPQNGYVEYNKIFSNDFYSYSKILSERYLSTIAQNNKNFSAFTLRLAGVHGNGRQSGALANIYQAAVDGKKIVVSEKRSVFRWLFIDDIPQVIDNVLKKRFPGQNQIFNIASHDIFSLQELAHKIKNITLSTSNIKFKNTRKKRFSVMNIDKAIKKLNFKPKKLNQLLKNYKKK